MIGAGVNVLLDEVQALTGAVRATVRRLIAPRGRCTSNRKSWSASAARGAVSAGCGVVFGLSLITGAIVVGADQALAQDPTRPGAARAASSFPKTRPFGPVTKVDTAQPLYLQGDELVYDSQGSKVTARGNVEIYFNDYILTADEVIYDQTAGTLTASGNVVLKEPSGVVTRGESITLTDDFRDGFVQSLSAVGRDDTRIAAERAERRGGTVTEFRNGKFTPCKTQGGQPPLWCVSAVRIVHDQEAATITYQDAQFEVLGVPVLWLPFFQHADPSVKRKSGFLVPEIGQSTDLGFIFEQPYFYALAPNMDFTFSPRYMSNQGVLWQGEWRHRLAIGSATGQYSVKLAGIDQDSSNLPKGTSAERAAELDGWRGSMQTKGLFSLASWWRLGWDVTVESDDAFRRFYKLDNILQTDRVNSLFLQGLSERNYFAVTGYHFGGLQFDRDTSIAESRVHPVVDWSYVLGQPVMGGELSWNVNAVALSRNQTITGSALDVSTSVNRVSADVNWRRRLTDQIGITYTPFANLRGDLLQLTDYFDPQSRTYVEDESVARGVASAGVLAAYPWIARSAMASHVVEPIGQVIGRTAKVDQRNLPIEDARSLVLDDTNLFEVDKFSGYDRVETGTRANVGLQYTFQLNAGGHARLLAGQSFHLTGTNAFAGDPGVDAAGKNLYSPFSGLESDRSDYVLAAYIAPSAMFRTIAQARFDEDDFDLRRADVIGDFNYGPVTARAIYAYTASNPSGFNVSERDEQQDIYGSLGLRLTDNWSIMATARYDIDDKFRIQDSFAVKYADECFVLTATYTETFIRNNALGLEPDRTLMLRFELRHLGDFRYKTDALDYFFAENQSNVQ